MSAVFYGYRVGKDSFWEMHAALREAYLAEHWLAQVATKLWPRTSEDTARRLLKRLDEKEVQDRAATEIQLFDEGTSYVIRPLEWAHGGFFHNQLERLSLPKVSSVHYDDRSDLSDEELSHKETVDWVEAQIRRGRYFVVPLIAVSDWRDLLTRQVADGVPDNAYDDREAEERFEELMGGIDRDRPQRPCPDCGSAERTIDIPSWTLLCANCGIDLIEAFVRAAEEAEEAEEAAAAEEV